MSSFEYLAALVSIVAGLALTRALSGLARVAHFRKEIGNFGVHIAWTASIVLWLVGFWWFTFRLASVETWEVPLLLFVLLYGSVIYFLIAMLYPDDLDPGTDMLEYLVENRVWFFVSFVGLGVLDLVDTWIKAQLYEIRLPPMVPYALLMTLWLAGGVVGAVTTGRRYHRSFAYVWCTIMVLWTVIGYYPIN